MRNRGEGYHDHEDLQADTPLGDERLRKSGPCVVSFGPHTNALSHRHSCTCFSSTVESLYVFVCVVFIT